MNAVNTIVAIFLVMAFYSFSITAYTFYLPSDVIAQSYLFAEPANSYSLNTLNEDVTQGLSRQTNIPVIDLGALVFYSGNFILDLALNFLTAIPQMLTLLLTGVLMIFGINTDLANMINAFLNVLVGGLYVISLILMLINVRSRGSVV